MNIPENANLQEGIVNSQKESTTNRIHQDRDSSIAGKKEVMVVCHLTASGDQNSGGVASVEL